MAISTYAELKAAIASYLNRDDLDAQIPDFVRSAHDVIVRDVRIPLVQKTATATIAADVGSVAVPSDFRAAVRFVLDADPAHLITPSSVEQVARNRVDLPDGYYVARRPMMFAREANAFVFWPVPTADTAVTLVYTAGPALLVNDTDTNVVLDRYPFLYLYGALSEGWRYVRNLDEEAKAESLFQTMIRDINRAEQADALMGGALRVTPSSFVV